MRSRHLSSQVVSIPSFTGGATGSSGNSAGNFLRTEGDTMIGPIAFFPKLVTINLAGEIDIGRDSGNYSSRIIVAPNAGLTDDLETILNAQFSGQLLFLQGIQGNTITIKTTGNIETILGVDFTLADDDILIFQFDVTDNKWQQITVGKQTAGGDNLGNHTATQDINFATFDGINIDRLIFVKDSAAFVAANYGFVVGSNDDFVLNVPTGENFTITEALTSFASFAQGDTNFIDNSGVSVLTLTNRNSGIIDLDQVGDFRFVADDDAGGENLQSYAKILVNADDVSAGAIEGRMALQVAEANTLESYVVLNLLGQQRIDLERNTRLTEGFKLTTNSDTTEAAYRDIGHTADPSSPSAGDFYYNTTTNVYRFFNGAVWGDVAGAGGAGANTSLSNLIATAINQSLIANATSTFDLGSGTFFWRETFTDKVTFQQVGISILGNASGMDFDVNAADNYEFNIATVQSFVMSTIAFDVLNKDIINIDDLIFDRVGQEVRSNADGLEFRVRTGDSFEWLINGVELLDLKAAAAQLNFLSTTSIINVPVVDFSITGQFITSDAGGLTYTVPNNDTHDFVVDGANRFVIDEDFVSLPNNNKIRPISGDIGFFVSATGVTVGAEGTVELPSTTTIPGSAAAADTAFGGTFGAIGVHDTGTVLSIFFRQNNGDWSQIVVGPGVAIAGAYGALI